MTNILLRLANQLSPEELLEGYGIAINPEVAIYITAQVWVNDLDSEDLLIELI